MKVNQLILVVFLFFSFALNSLGQQICANAVTINGGSQTIPPSDKCRDSSRRVYAYLYSDSSLLATLSTFRISSFKQYGNGGAFTVRTYGPFAEVEAGCDQIASSSPYVQSSSADTLGVHNVNINFDYLDNNRIYIFEIEFDSCYNGAHINQVVADTGTVDPPIRESESCQDCLPHFNPPVGKYVISAWVKEKNASVYTTSYTSSKITVYDGSTLLGTFFPLGNIIDGWQKIEGIFDLSSNGNLEMKLETTGSVTAYFDDIRVQPFNSSMVTYVYDPMTLRLVAELDERNYAKFYEYDEEGKLIRIKKETEKGVMTIQETRENSHK